jgi:hypothetical protein
MLCDYATSVRDPYTPTLAPSWAEPGDDDFVASWGDNMLASSPVHEEPPPPPPNEDAHSGHRLASIILNDMLDAEDRLMDMLDADRILAPPSRTISMIVTSLVYLLRTHHVLGYAFLLSSV